MDEANERARKPVAGDARRGVEHVAAAGQPTLFDDDTTPGQPTADRVRAADVPAAVEALAGRLRERFGDRLALGTSSWHFPGWAGLVWDRPVPAALLSSAGLAAYARHPLLSTVSLDRAFYRPLPATEYAALAAQVPPGFRFVVKAPALVTDACLRDARGRETGANPQFLDARTAVDACASPAAEGLGAALGVLVFQLSPLPAAWRDRPEALLPRLEAMLATVCAALPTTVVTALEVRDASWLTPTTAQRLRTLGVRYALGLHDRLPPIDDQLPMLRATWPGDLVCRWNLQRGQRYAEARDAWAPFDRLQAPDPATRHALARVAAATLAAGHRVFVTINNKAEGCAPASVLALAEAIDAAADAASAVPRARCGTSAATG
jgi:uncharacterized protein YecE (DUF72 family)